MPEIWNDMRLHGSEKLETFQIAFQRQNLVGHLAKNLMGLLVEKYDEIVKKIDTP